MNDLIRNIIIGIILVVLAYIFVLFQNDFFTTEEIIVETVSSEQEASDGEQAPQEVVKVTKKKVKKTNAAADGLSKFYASLNADMDSSGPKIKNNVVYLPDPKGDLIKQLDSIAMVTRPLSKTWRGSVESRPFRTGETLFQKLSEYSNNDGVEIIWWLNRDLVIKSPFRIKKSILKTAYQIGKAVEGHFQNGVRSYFCNKQRVIVLIEQELPYLDNECILLTTKTR